MNNNKKVGKNMINTIYLGDVKMANRVLICGVDTSKLPKLKPAELNELMIKVKQGDELAREQFVVANLRLVLSIVQRFSMHGDKSDDMFQVGCVGLMKAIDNFDVTLGLRFSTYAVPMVIGEIRRYLRDNTSIRVSRSIRDIAYKALTIKEEYAKKEHREPSVEELAVMLEVSPQKLSYALDAVSEIVSLNESVYNDGGETVRIIDQISDENTTENSLEMLALKEAIVKLNPREKEILNMRYFSGKTQMEVSNEVGISQAQVSRLEKSALDVIRRQLT